MMRFFKCGLPALAAALLVSGCVTTQSAVDDSLAPVRPLADQTPSSDAESRAKVHTELGEEYLGSARYGVALDEAKAALQSQGDYALAFLLQAKVYMYLGDNVLARDNFEHAVSIAPRDPDINNAYGWFLCSQGQEREGLAHLALAMRNPYYGTPTRPYANAGLCYLRLKDEQNARASFAKALEADPNNHLALFQLADIAYRERQYDVADRYLNALHQTTDPNAESAWLGLRIARKLGKRDEEASYVAQLQQRFPNSPEAKKMHEGKFE